MAIIKHRSLPIIAQVLDLMAHGNKNAALRVAVGLQAPELSALWKQKLQARRSATAGRTLGAKRQNLSPSVLAGLFARDHYVCRHCGVATLAPPALRYISYYFPELVPYHPNPKFTETHPLYWQLTASGDHMIPLARGGTNDLSNLITLCYICNTKKGDYLCEELGWTVKPPSTEKWDGLSSNFERAMTKQPVRTSYFLTWHKALRHT